MSRAAGRITERFYRNHLTPLLAIAGLLLGAFAILVTPREEDPQINVTMAEVFVSLPGASAVEVERLVTIPLEQVLARVQGVKHVYSRSRPGHALVTVRFKVGQSRKAAIVRVFDTLAAHADRLPAALGVSKPLVRPMGIDDVPVITATLWSDDAQRGAHELQRVAHTLEVQLQRVKGARDVYTVGGPDNVIRVKLDAARLAAYGLTVDRLRQALSDANVVRNTHGMVTHNAQLPLQAGEFLASREDVAAVVVALDNTRPVYLADVASISAGPDQPEHMVWYRSGPAAHDGAVSPGLQPAVTLAVEKKSGVNAVDVAEQVIERLNALKGQLIPAGVHLQITRNSGKTAADKAAKLLHKLVFVTLSVVLLALVTLGRREAAVVGSAVFLTLLVTLFASWAMGFTLNRVSLFALIFAIGILVDDAIVVLENIYRHRQASGDAPGVIPAAVDEVGGPTILATFTVIAALMPMAFVSGLMGPYMSPIPINASVGMLLSLGVALTLTPWLANVLLARKPGTSNPGTSGGAFFSRLLTPFMQTQHGARNRRRLWAGVLVLLLAAVSLVGFRLVILKMLPFDNKSRFQVVVDMPEGSSVENTNRLLTEITDRLARVHEVRDMEIYAGTAAPIDFNGLVRQYGLRQAPYLGDVQVNLVDKQQRRRSSHSIARKLRADLHALAAPYQAALKVVEVPPGPPVLAPLVAEVYGPDYAGQLELAKKLKRLFTQTPGMVDVDDSVEADSPRWIMAVDRQRAALLGVDQSEVVRTVKTALDGWNVTYVHNGQVKYPMPVRLELPVAAKGDMDRLLSMQVKGRNGALVSIGEVVRMRRAKWQHNILHKDLLPVVYVTGDVAGKTDSPLYGMFDLVQQIRHGALNKVPQHFTSQPGNSTDYSIKWDGEWQITYETFRDMGLAYIVGLLLIYLLVVATFQSYTVPLIIMAPIPLTLLGVMPGHALLGAQFTATSMIGMIALAGIIVRNSILLVDFIQLEVRRGVVLEQAVCHAASVRARPILITAAAAMLGALFILDDPIFSGLAVSLLFGILVSTLLTLVVIPLLYFGLQSRRQSHTPKEKTP